MTEPDRLKKEVMCSMMKKLIMTAMAALLVFSLTACTVSEEGSSSGASQGGSQDPSSKAESAGTSKQEEKGTLGNYTVEIQSAQLAKDYEGNDALIVRYSFTNNGVEPQSFLVAVDDRVYQDGVELSSAIITGNDDYDAEASMKSVQKGATLEVQKAYKLSNTTSPVSVECSELISTDNEKVVNTFAIGK